MGFIFSVVFIYLFYKVLKWLFSSSRKSDRSEVSIRYEVSGTNSYQDRDNSIRPKGKPARWYGKGEAVIVKGYEISDGLIYVGENLPDSSGYQNDACLINPNLKVLSSEPCVGGDEMGYWPQYESIPAKCRGAYLKWLADGRSDSMANIGYVFLFFYGLERRLFIDGQKHSISKEERLEIVEEVKRLRQLYGKSRSFRGYATNFLAMEWVLYQTGNPVPDYIDFGDRYCTEPFQVALAQYVVAGNPIPADLARYWMILHPEFGLRTPARRCAKEFESLFEQRYEKMFGDGLIIKPNKTRLKPEYRAASSSLGRVALNLSELPNPFSLKGPLKKLGDLVEDCTVLLEPYSRFLGRKDSDPESLVALSLLPKELMVHSPVADKAKACLSDICLKGFDLITTKTLYGIFGEPVPPTINKKEAEAIVALVEGMGFGLAPDVRFHNIKPISDGNVVIFPNGHGVDFQPSREYRVMCTILRLGSMVSQIDQDLSPQEEEILLSLIINNRELTGIEKDSLKAFLYWCLRTPQNIAGLKQTLVEVGDVEKSAISQILISVAHADGRIDPREIKELEKLYTTLGLEKQQVTSDLHKLGTADEPVTVGRRDPESSFAIPKHSEVKKDPSVFCLDDALIRIREEETRQVKGVLENIFVDQEEDGSDLSDASVGPTDDANPLSGLDEVHQKLFTYLLTQQAWERAALHDKCKEMGLMFDGAMEVLNEWAYEKANAPLIDDGEPVYVDMNLAKEIIDA